MSAQLPLSEPAPGAEVMAARPARRRAWIGGGAALLLVLLAAWFAATRQATIDAAFAAPVSVAERLQTFTTIFLGIFIEAAPFLLAGALASGFVEVFVRPAALARLIPRQPVLAALAGAALGLALPVCECGIVVVVRRLLAKGLPLRVGVAFLLAAPVVNPIVFASTLTAFGPGRMLLARFALSFIIAAAIALLFGAARAEQVLRAEPPAGSHQHQHAGHHHHAYDHHHGHDPEAAAGSLASRARAAVSAAADDLFDVGRYLVAGSLLAAALQALVPQQAILEVGSGAVSSVLVLSLLAFVISVCSTVDAFVALSFVGTFTPASILAFLVFGPMVDIKSSLMFSSIFRPRVVVYLILLPFSATLVASLLLGTQVGF